MRIRTKEVPVSVPSESAWFYVPRPIKNPKLRLFCFPYAGGTAEIYHQWPESLSDDIEVCALQLPGRSGRRREAPLKRISVLVDELLRIIKPYLDKPFAFFGHSMGVLIAYELIHALSKKGLKAPVHFFVSAHKALHISDVTPPIHSMTMDECIALVRPFNIIPNEVLDNREMMNFIMPVVWADFEMVETWSLNPSYPRLTMPVWAFGGVYDILATPGDIGSWRDYAQNEFRTFIFPGEHLFLLKPEIRAAMLQLINRTLAPWTELLGMAN